MKISILRTYNRNDSISIGMLVIKDELERKGHTVDVCDYQSAFKYTHVLVSMTATDDIYHIYKNCKKHRWGKRTFKAFVGGFGCQNPIALSEYIDYAFFGRADGIIDDILREPFRFKENLFDISKPHKVNIRQVNKCYPFRVTYGKNKIKWQEKFIGCPFRCKFCHYSHNRTHVGTGYRNDQLTASAEVMLKDIVAIEKKPGRLTTALDGYSERLRYKFGKKISWDMVEDSIDHLSEFKGNLYLKLYNITNFPTEQDSDRAEFFDFFRKYAEDNYKGDGCVTIDVFNTAFRPSINTPMERMPARLYPEARQDISTIAKCNGYNFKFTHFTRGAWEHLKDLISIRYTEKGHIDHISSVQGNGMEGFLSKYDISDYVREYKGDEALKFKWIK